MSSLCFAHRKFGLILLLLIVSAICPSRVQAASLNLTWTDTSGNEAGFKIERSTNGRTFTQIATVSAGVTSYTDPGLVAGTMYCYQVRAYNSGGTSNPSNQACTIATEGNGDVPVGDSSLRLSWADTSGNEDGFKMERLNGSAFTQIATVGANVTSYTDSGLVAGKTYCYRVRAYNSGGTSDPSNQACANATDSNGSVVVDGSAGGSTSGDSTGIEDSTPAKESDSAQQVGAQWKDYRVTLKMLSTDNDAIGVMFRYVDNRNYYRFSWNTEEKYRRLEKFQNGKRTILAEDAVRYASGRTYKLQIVAQGTTLQVRIDDSPVFSVTDSSLEAGTVALYSWYNAGSVFDDLLVENLPTGETLLWNDFNNDASFLGWTIVDEGPSSGPSEWFVDKGVLNQTGNIGAGSDKPGTFAVFKTY